MNCPEMHNCEINRHECKSICRSYAIAGFALGASTMAFLVAATQFIVYLFF